jgi:hypothetical protein
LIGLSAQNDMYVPPDAVFGKLRKVVALMQICAVGRKKKGCMEAICLCFVGLVESIPADLASATCEAD